MVGGGARPGGSQAGGGGPRAGGNQGGGVRGNPGNNHANGGHYGDNRGHDGHHGDDRGHDGHYRHGRNHVNVYFGGFGYPYYGYGYGFGYPYSGYGYGYPYGYGYGSGYGYGYSAAVVPSYTYDPQGVYTGRVVNRGRQLSLEAQVQQQLAQAGYYRGAIDGIVGENTRRAIRSYERDNKLRVDGRIDDDLLATMGLG